MKEMGIAYLSSRELMLTSEKVRPTVQLVGVASRKSTPLDVFALLGHVASRLGGLAGGSGVGRDSLVGSHC